MSTPNKDLPGGMTDEEFERFAEANFLAMQTHKPTYFGAVPPPEILALSKIKITRDEIIAALKKARETTRAMKIEAGLDPDAEEPPPDGEEILWD